MLKMAFVLASLCLLIWFSTAAAQHVLVLKNGRQITVQSYREEGSMIKFVGLGGEIGIQKDQIQAILKPGQSNRPGLSMSELETTSGQAAESSEKTSSPSAPTVLPRVPSSGETESPNGGEEVKEYQKRLAEVTQKLETAKQNYFEATQGGGSAKNLSKEGIRSWAMDFASRIHDSQKVPGGGGAGDTPPTPPYAPIYTAKEKELSDLRSEIDSLQKERDALIEEMKAKNIPTGAP